MKFIERFKNIANKKFGRLQAKNTYNTVIKSGPKQKYPVYYVPCVCDCGNECNINAYCLLNGETLSCGCYSREISRRNLSRYLKNNPVSCKKLPNYERLINRAFASYKKRSQLKNMPFELTKLKFIELVTTNCYYCDILNKGILKDSTTKFSEGFNGIDRKNNSLGYIESNCVSCCKICNYLKSSYNEDEFLLLIKRIYENKNK